MKNIFKTTLKKDIIADILNNGTREVRFPITKFWTSRFTEKYDTDNKTYIFKTFDSVELSSPSNKETCGDKCMFDFDRIFVDNNEFVIIFKDQVNDDNSNNINIKHDVDSQVVVSENDSIIEFDLNDSIETEEEYDSSDVYPIDSEMDNEILLSNDDMFTLISQWFDDEMCLDDFYEDKNIFATNAKQIIILPKGNVLGFKKTLPVNNDAELRIEFNTHDKIYFDTILEFDHFKDEINKLMNNIRKNNFVFIWKRYTGIFMDKNGIYFGIKYSTRTSNGFNRKYNVQ